MIKLGDKLENSITEDKKNSKLNTPMRKSSPNKNTNSATNSGNYNNNNNNSNINIHNQQNVSGSNDIYYKNMIRMQNMPNFSSPLNNLNDPLAMNNINNSNQRNNLNPKLIFLLGY